MKRFIVMPGSVLLLVAFISVWFSLQTRKVEASVNMPILPENLTPGHLMPQGIPCYHGTPDGEQRYCHPEPDVDIVIKDNGIVRSYMFIYPQGTTIGQLILAWGEPISAEYDAIGATTVYWHEHYAYVLTQQGFSPYSRVGYVAYGVLLDLELRPGEPWRGFAVQAN